MPGFTPPNPYGSFFNFQDPAAMAQQSFLPNPTGTMSPGTLAAMGAPVGGFNPSLAEFSQNRYRDVAYQQFIARSLATDPTTRTFSNVVMEMLFKDKAERGAAAAKYGQSNIDAMVGMALNMPGISQFMGGSARSLSIGALAAGTSGMRWNNVGMFGDGQVQLMGATRILDTVRQNFYTSSGAQKLNMTQGLNKDQLGAILAAGGSQGAFAGLDMGTIDRAGKFKWNEGSFDKIKDFTKSAAKAISGLIDIYGDASFNELYDKAQRITGMDLSRLKNADIIQSRLQALRTTAQVSGVDVATMNDLSAGTVNYGQAMGFSRSASGAVAASVAGPAAWMYQMSRQTAGIDGFFQPDRPINTIGAEMARDRFGMIRDPLGARRNAVELLIQQGMIKGGDAVAARQQAQDATPFSTGSLDAFVSGHYGVNLPSFIRRMGGARGVFDYLSPENQTRAIAQGEPDLQRRFQRIMDRNVTGSLRDLEKTRAGASNQFNNIKLLMGDLDPTTIFNLLGAADTSSGDPALKDILGKSMTGRTGIDKYLGAAKGLEALAPGGAQGIWQNLQNIKMSNHLTRNIFSKDEQSQLNNARFRQFGGLTQEKWDELQHAAMESRGQLRGGLLQGFLERHGGTDIDSVMAIALSTEQGQKNITGRYPPGSKEWFMQAFDLSPENLTSPKGVATLKQLRTIMKGMPGGKDALEASGLMERGLDKTITTQMAADFATRYATNPLSVLPGFSGIRTPKGEVFANANYLNTIKDETEGLRTLAGLETYFGGKGSKASPFVKDSLSRQFGKLQDSVTSGKISLQEFYGQMTKEAVIANMDPEMLSSLAAHDSMLAKMAQNTVTNMQEGDSKNKRLAALSDILEKTGGLMGGYRLVGSINPTTDGRWDLGNVMLEPASKGKGK